MILTDELREQLVEQTDDDAVEKLYERFLKQYGDPKRGSSRATFLVSDYLVIKVPLTADDVVSQYNEVDFAKEHPEIPCAKNWMEVIDGVPVVWMERVEPLEYHERHRLYDIKPWKDLRDGPQCGRRPDGEIVCFDLGYEYW